MPLTHPQPARHFRDLVDSHPHGGFVEIHVTAFRIAAFQHHIAMSASFPAVKPASADLNISRAVDHGRSRDDARLKCGEAGGHLERRTRRIGPLNGLVGQRETLVLGQNGIILVGNAPHKKVGVKTGGRGDCQQIPILHVHHDGRRRLFAKPCLHVVLHVGIDCQANIGPGVALLPAEFAHHAADGVHLDPLTARLAAQRAFHPGFDADLADLKLGGLKQRVRCIQLFQVVVTDRTDIADDMGKIGIAWIAPAEPEFGRHTWQGRRVDRDFRHIFPTQPVCHDNRLRAASPGLFHRAAEIFGRNRQDGLQPAQDVFDIARVIAIDDDAVILLVPGDQLAVAVIDQPARRWDQADGNAVVFGQQAKLVGLLDLHLSHPRTQNGNDGHHRSAQKQ